MITEYLRGQLTTSSEVSKGTINNGCQRDNRVTLQKRPQKYFRGQLTIVAKETTE